MPPICAQIKTVFTNGQIKKMIGTREEFNFSIKILICYYDNNHPQPITYYYILKQDPVRPSIINSVILV